MRMVINGEDRDVKEGITISALLTELELEPDVTVVQRNGDIVNRDAFDTTQLSEGDVLELVRFVGGG